MLTRSRVSLLYRLAEAMDEAEEARDPTTTPARLRELAPNHGEAVASNPSTPEAVLLEPAFLRRHFQLILDNPIVDLLFLENPAHYGAIFIPVAIHDYWSRRLTRGNRTGKAVINDFRNTYSPALAALLHVYEFSHLSLEQIVKPEYRRNPQGMYIEVAQYWDPRDSEYNEEGEELRLVAVKDRVYDDPSMDGLRVLTMLGLTTSTAVDAVSEHLGDTILYRLPTVMVFDDKLTQILAWTAYGDTSSAGLYDSASEFQASVDVPDGNLGFNRILKFGHHIT